MIDIHTHILPGVDDGARSLDEAFDMVVMAAGCGVQALVATPHSNHDMGFVNYDSDSLAAKFNQLCKMLKEEHIPIQLFRGMEIWASTDIVEKLSYGKLLTMNGTRYVLVEFAFDEEPWWIEAVLREMLCAGYLPILAHPERYCCVQEVPNLLYEWRKMGVFAQMNKGSILGRFGKRAEEASVALLRHNLVNCIASDAHHAYTRTTDLTALKRYMDRHFSLGYRELLLNENPRAILEGKNLKMAEKFTEVR